MHSTSEANLWSAQLYLTSALDGFTVDLEERPHFVTIDCKSWKLDLLMPKVDPNTRVISGPEIVYFDGEREREKG